MGRGGTHHQASHRPPPEPLARRPSRRAREQRVRPSQRSVTSDPDRSAASTTPSPAMVRIGGPKWPKTVTSGVLARSLLPRTWPLGPGGTWKPVTPEDATVASRCTGGWGISPGPLLTTPLRKSIYRWLPAMWWRIGKTLR